MRNCFKHSAAFPHQCMLQFQAVTYLLFPSPLTSVTRQCNTRTVTCGSSVSWATWPGSQQVTWSPMEVSLEGEALYLIHMKSPTANWMLCVLQNVFATANCPRFPIRCVKFGNRDWMRNTKFAELSAVASKGKGEVRHFRDLKQLGYERQRRWLLDI